MPGPATVTLDKGTWVVFERTGTVSGGGGVTFSSNHAITIGAEDLVVTGKETGRLPLSADDGIAETLNRNGAVYTGAVRFTAPSKGSYTFSSERSSAEVTVGRPLSSVFHQWPWFLGALAGAAVMITGLALTFSGVRHRKAAREAA